MINSLWELSDACFIERPTFTRIFENDLSPSWYLCGEYGAIAHDRKNRRFIWKRYDTKYALEFNPTDPRHIRSATRGCGLTLKDSKRAEIGFRKPKLSTATGTFAPLTPKYSY